MKCDEMEILLSGYIDGEVTLEEKQAVENHLQGCDACRTTVTEFSRLHVLYHELERQEAPPWFRQRVTQRLAAKPRFGRMWLAGRLPRLAYALLWALLVFTGGAMVAFHLTKSPSSQFGEQGASDVEVYAEDILFDPVSDSPEEIFSVEEIGAAEEILDTIDFSDGESPFSGDDISLRHHAPHLFKNNRYI